MINNDVLLSSATNEETLHEQLLRLLFSFNIENQAIKKKKASTKNRETLKNKTFRPNDNWQFIIVKFFWKPRIKIKLHKVSYFMLLILKAINYI